MEFLENWRQERNSTRDTVLNSLGRITSQVDELNSQMIDLPNVTLLNDTNAIWIKNEAFRIRKSMNKIWRNNLNQRKQAFWNMLKNENTSVIYVDWFSRENAIIPKKFQSKTFANEPEELKKIRGTFIGKDEGTGQTSPCGSSTQQSEIRRKGQRNAE